MPPSPEDDLTKTVPPAGGPPGQTTDDLTLPPRASAEADPVEATRVAGFELLQELGRGGMGVVYKARQVALNREVALKMVLAGAHASAADRARFLAEAEAIAAIRHPGIVQVYDFGTHAGQPYFALEFCAGGALDRRLGGTPMVAAEAASLVATIARAVEAAHQAKILHRDLKPSNILLAADGAPKIVDFGLARKTEVDSGLTRTGAILGTPSYMSPEQANGAGDGVGPATDIYSLGAVLYECLTGRPPFRAATAVDTILQVVGEEPVPPSRLNAKVPRDLETICLKCLEKQPHKRYASAAALADDLDRFLAGEPIHARPASALERAVKLARRNPGRTAAAALTAAAVVAFLAYQNVQNARLQRQTEAARKAEAEAVEATAQAEDSRRLAQARLEKAVKAVEQVVLRVAGEKWALRPELQTERRETLEEAIAFFNGLGSEESKEPTVRRQAARAHLLTAIACLSLGEYDRVGEAARAARALYRGLSQESPRDPEFVRGEGEAVALVGHVGAIRARFNDALANYQETLKVAERAVALDPGDGESQLLLADANSSLGMFYGTQRPDLARQYHQKALAIGEALAARTAPSYRARLVVATALVNLANADVSRLPAEAEKKLARAGEQLRSLEGSSPPSPRAVEIFLVTKASHAFLRGTMLLRAMRADEGLASMRDGLGSIEKLLALQPKAFSGRIQNIQMRVSYAAALLSADRVSESRAVFDDVVRKQEELIREQPELTWLRSLGLVQRATLLIRRLQIAYFPEFAAEAERLLESAAGPSAGVTYYNVACIYAQASALAPPAERARYADRAMELLKATRVKTDFFRWANANQLDTDADLNPLRGRADFAEFVKAVKSARRPAPK